MLTKTASKASKQQKNARKGEPGVERGDRRAARTSGDETRKGRDEALEAALFFKFHIYIYLIYICRSPSTRAARKQPFSASTCKVLG